MSASEIVNPRTGERITFIVTGDDSAGALLEMHDVWISPQHRTPRHSHPNIEETWEVLGGEVTFEIGERTFTAKPGDIVKARPGVPHTAWNVGGKQVRLRIQMRPALRWQECVTRMFELANEADEAQPQLLELIAEFPSEIAI